MHYIGKPSDIAAIAVYLASRVKEAGIWHCILEDNGVLIKKKLYPVDRPAFMCMNGDTLYVLLREPFMMQSGIVSYHINSDGSLEALTAPESVHGAIAAHIYARDGKLWCANYLNGTVIRMPDKMLAINGHGANMDRQSCSHPHCITPTPDGKYLCVGDLGTDRIFVLTEDLDIVSEAVMPAGSGPRHMVFSPDRCYAFCAIELGNTVEIMSYADGILKIIGSISTIPEDFTGDSTVKANLKL